jgi:hypothetical protein
MRRRRSSRSDGVSGAVAVAVAVAVADADADARGSSATAPGGAALNIGEAPNDPVERRASLFRRDIVDTIHRFSAARKACAEGSSSSMPSGSNVVRPWSRWASGVSSGTIIAPRVALTAATGESVNPERSR